MSRFHHRVITRITIIFVQAIVIAHIKTKQQFNTSQIIPINNYGYPNHYMLSLTAGSIIPLTFPNPTQ